MTSTAERAGATSIRTVRMYDDAWELMGRRSRDRSPFIRDMTDAGLNVARCYRCLEPVPVEYGDLTGRPLAEWVELAGKTVTRQHRDGHHPVTIGNGQDAPAAGAVPSAVFRPPSPREAKGRQR